MSQRLSSFTALLVGLSCMTVLCINSQAASIEVVTEDSSYSYLRDGKVTGPGSRLVEDTLQGAGLGDYHMALYPWARAYDMALLEPYVLIFPMVRTPDREAHFKWVGEMAKITPVFYKLREQHDIAAQSLDDAKRYIVGVVRDDSRQIYLQQQGFTRMVVSANNMDNFHKLLNGQVQLVAMPERDARLICDDAHIAFGDLEAVYTLDGLSAGLYMAFSLGTPDDLVAKARTRFDQLKASGQVARRMNER